MAAHERGAEARAGGAARLALARRRAIGAMVAPRSPPALGRLRLRLDDDVSLNDGFEWGVFLVGNARDKRPSRKEVRKGTGPFPEVHGFHDEVWERTQRAASLFDDDPNAGKWLRQQAHYFHRAHVTLRRATHRVAHDRVARGRPGAGFTHSGGGLAVAREGEVDPPSSPSTGPVVPPPTAKGSPLELRGGELFCGEHPRG